MNYKNIELESKIFSSSHLNFFFGAGVNGKSFPQMLGFIKTHQKMFENLGREIINFEDDILELTDAKIKTVFGVFKKELLDFAENVDYNSSSVKDIESLFQNVNKLIVDVENRTKTTKQVNIYTTNYDKIVENTIKNLGLLCNVISSSNLDNHDKFFELIGYDYGTRKFIPTYLISQIHGDLNNPILPSRQKFDEALQAKRFEILFKMKTQLSRSNSLLLVIGYSGRDKHLNSILKDCVTFGLTIYWYRYKKTDIIPDEIKDNVTIVDQDTEDGEELQNTTLICSEMLKRLWEKPLEE